MEKFDVYQDIAMRCNGDIYVGVVGPVRSGKSTFITKFLQELVIDKISDKNKRQRTIDELPQSAGGKTIMTTQPRFVPDEAAVVNLDKNVTANIRLIDCVGYLIDDAAGHMENGKPRLVNTPWSESSMPFEKAAEFGTQKVINEHSTIGILVTSDGSITEIERSSYVKAEERVVSELKALGKPFVIVLNSKDPQGELAKKLQSGLMEKYGVPVLCVDVLNMKEDTVTKILESVLYEFPLKRVFVGMPKWMQALGYDNQIVKNICDSVYKKCQPCDKMRDFKTLESMCDDIEDVESCSIANVSLGEGRIEAQIATNSELYYKVLSHECGVDIADDFALISYIKSLKEAKKAYDKLKDALESVERTGYGVVAPTLSEMVLDKPEIVKQSGRFGVKLKAQAPSLHIMKVEVDAEISPIVGTEQQSKELLDYLQAEFASNPNGIWDTNMFGKSVYSLVSESLSSKLSSLPIDAQEKMRKTLARILNEGKGGVLCILL